MNLFRSGRNWGMTLLAVWLIIFGLLHFLAIPRSADIMAILALVAGVLLLLNR
jgi:hypothetical protein